AVESNGRGLVDHDAPRPGIDARVSRTQVNCQVRREQAQQWAQIVEGDSGYPVEAHNTNWFDRGESANGWLDRSPVCCRTGQGTGRRHLMGRPIVSMMGCDLSGVQNRC